MRIFLLPLLLLTVYGQEFDSNFEKMITEVNRGRFDKAMQQLFPVQAGIRAQTDGKPPQMDAGLMARAREMDNTGAVLSTLALVRSQITAKNYEEAALHSMLLGMGLSGLWNKVPAYKKLDYAKQDLEESPPHQRELELRKLGYAAVDANEWDLARKTATEIIRIADSKDYMGPDPGAAKHSALTLRGLAELATGDLVSAEKSLLASMKVQTESGMRIMGPNFRLARALLSKGRKQSVDQFLALVAESSWRDSSKAEQWRKDLAAGKEPELPRYSGF
jgi:hypothetical protein